jgi:murein DD-endopeptidase MepM/ murein hydrolase activator NlpD
MRRVLAAVVLALTVAPAASAHVDDPVQLDLRWPASGTVTTQFGWTEGRWHAGLDIGTLGSLDVRAAAPGRVRVVGAPGGYDGYGTVVVIGVGGPFETIYAHLAWERVRAGQIVGAGELLGAAGCTGWCTGTHLHFELRERGRAIDPSLLLPNLIGGRTV